MKSTEHPSSYSRLGSPRAWPSPKFYLIPHHAVPAQYTDKLAYLESLDQLGYHQHQLDQTRKCHQETGSSVRQSLLKCCDMVVNRARTLPSALNQIEIASTRLSWNTNWGSASCLISCTCLSSKPFTSVRQRLRNVISSSTHDQLMVCSGNIVMFARAILNPFLWMTAINTKSVV